MTQDIRWQQRFQNFDRAMVLLRHFDQAVLAIHDRYLAALDELHGWLLERRVSP